MSPLVILMAASALGVEAGWQPLATGGHEYTIQIEPSLVRLLESGHDLVSEVPAHVDVRRFRIILGDGKLARIDEPASSGVGARPDAQPSQPSESFAGQPFEDTPPATDWPALPADADAFDQPFAAPRNDLPGGAPTADLGTLPPPPADRDAVDDAMTVPAADGEDSASAAMPANFDDRAAGAQPLDQNATGTSHPHATEKPELGSDAEFGADDATSGTNESRPWVPLAIAVALLACSLGANVYLGWLARDARTRYRAMVSKLRTVPSV